MRLVSGDLRNRILARRARFVGSALALAGCSPSTKPANVAVIEPIDAAAIPTATSSVSDPPRDAGPPPSPGKRGPYFTIPDGITPETRKRYDLLEQRMTEFHKVVDDLDKEMQTAPKCPGNTCDDFWREIAGKIEELGTRMTWLYIFCPNPQREETDRFLQVAKEQREQAEKLRGSSQAKAESMVGGKAKFERYQSEYDKAHPRPCLSFACDRWRTWRGDRSRTTLQRVSAHRHRATAGSGPPSSTRPRPMSSSFHRREGWR